MKQKIFNIIIAIISLMALCFSLLKITPFSIIADTYIGIIVTMLSIIVTIVIGYQIFNILEFKNKLESHSRENDILRTEIKQTQEDVTKMKDDLQKRIIINEQLSLMRDNENEAQFNFNSNPDKNCLSCISSLMNALYYGLETNCNYLDSLFYEFRKYITHVSPLALDIIGSMQKGEKWYVNCASEWILLDDWVDSQCGLIIANDKRIRNHKNYDSIKYEYGRLMKIFNGRIEQIKNNPNNGFTQEENQAIMDDTVFGF